MARVQLNKLNLNKYKLRLQCIRFKEKEAEEINSMIKLSKDLLPESYQKELNLDNKGRLH